MSMVSELINAGQPEAAMSRRGLLRAGGQAAAVVGVVATVGLATAMPAGALQSNWRYCVKCSGLWFNNNDNGACPGGGGHSLVGSGNYQLKSVADGGSGQPGWRHCQQCNGLWFSVGGLGNCPSPAFAQHSLVGSGDYKLENAAAPGAGQTGWRHCQDCRGLWFAFNGANVCPAGGNHTPAGSGDYKLREI